MRAALTGLAVALGAVAVWLVVFGAGRQQVQVGVLLGLWAALIAAFLFVGTRPADGELTVELAEARARAAELHQAQLRVVAQQQEQLEAARQSNYSQEIELRQFSELQLARDAEARRESEHGLRLAMRNEVERVLVDQLSSLRQEVASLRAEVVDKLGGQLRLERIETTRVIGSDLEALQHEIRRLAEARPTSLATATRTVLPAAQPEPERSGRIVEAEAPAGRMATPEAEQVSRAARPEPERTGWDADPEPRTRRAFDAGPARVTATPPRPAAGLVEFPPPASELPTAPAGPAAAGRPAGRSEPGDPFASLPRLSPVQDDLDLIPDSAPNDTDRAELRQGRRRAPEPEDDSARYQGRRRAGGAHANWLASFDG